jgi:hypothetical protein
MEVSGDIHAPAVLLPGISPQYTLGGPQRQFWFFGKDCCVTLTFLSLVFLSAFLMCLFFLPVFHILFPTVFPVFVSSFYLIHFLLLSLLPHFLPKLISTPFHILLWRSRLFILHLVTRTVWNNSALALVLGRSFMLEIHTKSIPECDRCSMTPTLWSARATWSGVKGEIRDGRSWSEDTFTVA